MEILIIPIVIMLLVYLAISRTIKRAYFRRQREQQEYERQQREYEQQQHTMLNAQRENKLSEVLNITLEQYDRQGIRIPLDIIEDLQHEQFSGIDDCMRSVEQQRNNWKLENSKKVMK